MPPHERPAFVPTIVLVSLAVSALCATVLGPASGTAASAPPPAHPARIVSLALESDEVLLAVAPDRIAALDEFVDDVASNVRTEARAVPRRVRPIVEDVLGAVPDCVFVSAWSSTELRSAIARAGVPLVLVPPPTTLAEVSAGVREIGRAAGEPDATDALVRDMDARIEAVRSRRAGRPRPRVLFRSVDGIAPGRGTLVEALVEAAGGTLVTAELGLEGFVPLPTERAMSIEADVVLVDAYRADGRARSLAGDPALAALGRRARVVELPPHLVQTTSHHVAATVEALADLFEER